MILEECTNEELIKEIIRRNIELKIHIDSVEVSVNLGGIDMGDAICK